MQPTARDFERYDKRKAAIHEAGHLTAAMALGDGEFCRAWLFKADTANPETHKTWGGYFSCINGMTAIVAVAGVVAELWEDDDENEITSDEILEAFSDETIIPSSTDKSAFPPEGELRSVVDRSLFLLRKHNLFFDWAVKTLIEGDSITDYMAAEKFRELYE